MGHIRLGRLPRTVRWNRVVAALGNRPGQEGVDDVAELTLIAASGALQSAASEPGCYRPLAALSELCVAARDEHTFSEQLDRLGVSGPEREDGLRLLQALDDTVFAAHPGEPETVLSEIARRAYRETLYTIVRVRSEGLWEIAPADIQRTLRGLSTEAGYRDLARTWFARFIGRSLQYFLDRELSNHVGGAAVGNSAVALELERSMLAYATERTRIMADFAPAWLSKTLWEEGGLPEAKVKRFFGYAIQKVLRDVAAESRNL
jgi:hypothetical protein